MKITVKDIALNGIIAASYFVLTLITFPISFLGIQFRVAEILILLCFFNKKCAIGCTLGCILANLFSSIGFIDVLFGSLATLLSCVLIGFCKHLIVASIIPVVINAFVIGYELYAFLDEPFWISTGFVALGELGVMVLAYIICKIFNAKLKLLLAS